MRWIILTTIVLLILITSVSAIEVCEDVTADGETFEVCYESDEETPPECTSNNDCPENQECISGDCVDIQQENPPEGHSDEETNNKQPQTTPDVRTSSSSDGGNGNPSATVTIETKQKEKAEVKLEIKKEKITEKDTIEKPNININLEIKEITRIPPRIDAKLTPYSIYSILILSAASLLMTLWIIKDIIEPKFRI